MCQEHRLCHFIIWLYDNPFAVFQSYLQIFSSVSPTCLPLGSPLHQGIIIQIRIYVNSLLAKKERYQDFYKASGTMEKPECKARKCLRLMAKGSIIHSLGEHMKTQMCITQVEEQRHFQDPEDCSQNSMFLHAERRVRSYFAA